MLTISSGSSPDFALLPVSASATRVRLLRTPLPGKPALPLEALDFVGEARIVEVRVGGALRQAEMRPEGRHAGIVHPDLQGRTRRQRERLGARHGGAAQGRELRLEGTVALRGRVVAREHVAGLRSGLGELAEHGIRGGQVEGRRDQSGDRRRVDPPAAGIAGIEHRRRGEAQLGIGHRLVVRFVCEVRHRIGAGVEPSSPAAARRAAMAFAAGFQAPSAIQRGLSPRAS